jgi:hypothetical protein
MFTMKSEVVILFKVMTKKIVKDGTLQFESPQISRAVLYGIITFRLDCHKFCA